MTKDFKASAGALQTVFENFLIAPEQRVALKESNEAGSLKI